MGNKGKKDQIKQSKQQKKTIDKKLKNKQLGKVQGGQMYPITPPSSDM